MAADNYNSYKQARELAVRFLKSIEYRRFNCEKSAFTYGDYGNCIFYITDIDENDYHVSVYNVFDDVYYVVSIGKMLGILKDSVFIKEVK